MVTLLADVLCVSPRAGAVSRGKPEAWLSGGLRRSVGFLLGHSGNLDPVSDLCGCQPFVFFGAGDQGRASSLCRGHTPAHQHPGKQLSGCHRDRSSFQVPSAIHAPGNVFTSVHFIPGSLGVAGRARLRGWPGEGSLRAWAGPRSPHRAPGRPHLPHHRLPAFPPGGLRGQRTRRLPLGPAAETRRELPFAPHPSRQEDARSPLPQLLGCMSVLRVWSARRCLLLGRSVEWKSPLQKRRGLGLLRPLTDCSWHGETTGCVRVSGAPGTRVAPRGWSICGSLELGGVCVRSWGWASLAHPALALSTAPPSVLAGTDGIGNVRSSSVC